MSSNFWDRDPDDWYQDKYIIREIIFKNTKLRINNNYHIFSDTDKPIYHSIQMQIFNKSRKGKWILSRQKINIPFESFPEFVQVIQEIYEKEYNKLEYYNE